MPAHIVRDLFKALDGDVGSRVPDKFLSQYWFGLILARGGVSPEVPREKRGRATPDFQVNVDTLDCAVEVKRPESEHSAIGAMDKAAGQLRDYGKPGLIAMDLTDLFFTPDMAVDHMDHPGLVNAIVNPRFSQFTTRLENRPPTCRWSDKYSRIVGTAFFVRLHFLGETRSHPTEGQIPAVADDIQTGLSGPRGQSGREVETNHFLRRRTGSRRGRAPSLTVYP
jgi:hypothetical protein